MKVTLDCVTSRFMGGESQVARAHEFPARVAAVSKYRLARPLVCGDDYVPVGAAAHLLAYMRGYGSLKAFCVIPSMFGPCYALLWTRPKFIEFA